jgi:acetyl-CoA synthetase
MAGDGAVQAKDGYYRILGRIDDVINVAGHRLGTKEIESAALLVGEVVEAAVVPVADQIKGKVPDLYVALKPGLKASKEITDKIMASVVSEIGAIARPRQVIIVPDMPKTRSGKIMRRVLAAISNRQDPGDVSTLANPEIVDRIREIAKAIDAR